MRDPAPQPIYRKDYRPPAFWIDAVDLHFDIQETLTVVTATLQLRRNTNGGASNAPLVLNGEKLALRSLRIDDTDVPAARYAVTAEHLRIDDTPDAFSLETVVELKPHENTELSGLYRSGATFCTQCEAEGFRRITYFADRPDVMAVYRTTIVADGAKYPVLLSNGNRVSSRELADGRREVCWEDPFRKPSYLFALVAADLRCHPGVFTTRKGRDVALEIWVEPQNIDACEHALVSLKKSMLWDEQVFGLEYDLDIYMIVAVSDFNMAAMENKGLNIFNAKYVLARPDTATDTDYENIEGVIGHEYFHNWTGNRVTCRDWFQLTLKEGLTVFRDEQFTADMTSPAVKRVLDVNSLRTSQFAEDASPTAHAIRPDSYIEMNNFYTVTVYSKGAEVIRMMHTLLGAAGFRKGMDLYFERHDGQAVTCDDFRAAMADANGVDLEQFGLWYRRHGTPTVHARGAYDAGRREYTLTLRQEPPSNATGAIDPMFVPVATGLVGPSGEDIPLGNVSGCARIDGTTALLALTEFEQAFVFANVDEPRAASVLRGFSAPVHFQIERDRETQTFLMAHDADTFCRWDAAQSLARDLLLEQCQRLSANEPSALDDGFVDAFGRILVDETLDASLKALTLNLPDERLLGQHQAVVDVDGLHTARTLAIGRLGKAHAAKWWGVYRDLDRRCRPYRLDREAVGHRRLKNVALAYLVSTGDAEAIAAALAQFRTADNMTDAFAAVEILCNTDVSACITARDEFLAKWRHDPLVVDKWFAVQAVSSRSDTLERVTALTQHPLYDVKNPNRVRALLGLFSVRNQARFHDRGGAGYALVAHAVLELDALNPQSAARLVGAFTQWRRFDDQRQASMKRHLGEIVSTPGLSRDVYELASKCLDEQS